MTTALDRTLKRSIEVDGVPYTLVLDSAGLRLTGKGKRKPQVEFTWKDLVSGDASLAVALRASTTG